jgi:hypothetical protein
MDITLPYLPTVVVTVNDMLGKVPKLRYADYDVRDAAKFPDLDKVTYLINIGQIEPLGKPIMEPTQWTIELYNSGIMNLLDIPHFGCSKNVRPYVKQLVSHIDGGIMWMDRKIQIDVALISKIIGLPTFDAQPEKYLNNKAREKEITELVKV